MLMFRPKIAKGINKYMCECILQNKQNCIFYKKRLEGLDMACTPLFGSGSRTGNLLRGCEIKIKVARGSS